MLGTSTTDGKIIKLWVPFKACLCFTKSSGFMVMLFLQGINVQIKTKRSLSFLKLDLIQTE